MLLFLKYKYIIVFVCVTERKSKSKAQEDVGRGDWPDRLAQPPRLGRHRRQRAPHPPPHLHPAAGPRGALQHPPGTAQVSGYSLYFAFSFICLNCWFYTEINLKY